MVRRTCSHTILAHRLRRKCVTAADAAATDSARPSTTGERRRRTLDGSGRDLLGAPCPPRRKAEEWRRALQDRLQRHGSWDDIPLSFFIDAFIKEPSWTCRQPKLPTPDAAAAAPGGPPSPSVDGSWESAERMMFDALEKRWSNVFTGNDDEEKVEDDDEVDDEEVEMEPVRSQRPSRPASKRGLGWFGRFLRSKRRQRRERRRRAPAPPPPSPPPRRRRGGGGGGGGGGADFDNDDDDESLARGLSRNHINSLKLIRNRRQQTNTAGNFRKHVDSVKLIRSAKNTKTKHGRRHHHDHDSRWKRMMNSKTNSRNSVFSRGGSGRSG